MSEGGGGGWSGEQFKDCESMSSLAEGSDSPN